MRVDLTGAAANQISSELNSSQVEARQTEAQGAAGSEDRTTFTSADHSLASLVSAAMSTPEIRQDRVESLRQSVSSGKYELDPEKIAQSMIDENA